MVNYLMSKYEIPKETTRDDTKAFIQAMLEADFIVSHST